MPFPLILKRSLFEELIAGYVQSTVRLTQALLEESRTQGCGVDTVVLIGGSCRVPLIARTLQQMLPVATQDWHERDLAVALGAAYHGHRLWPPPPPPEGFDVFLQARHSLGKLLHDLSDAFHQIEAKERAKHLLEAKSRLECDTFRVLVIGEFKRGKSTLINALRWTLKTGQ